MDAKYRKLFNAAYTDALYTRYVSEMSGRLGVKFNFRNAETPVFVPRALLSHLIETSNAILEQLLDPRLIERMQPAIPARWNTPGLSELPAFTMIDLAIVRDGDRLVPKLIELQGFPSLTALQVYKRDVWTELLAGLPGMDIAWSCWPGGLSRDAFLDLARRTIVGDHDPEHVIMMDLDPPSQGTYPDFVATQKLFGVTPICPTALVREGRQLFRPAPDGRGAKIPVKRIYNRVVFDELARSPLLDRLPFDYREPLDVEWCPHPNWFFLWSKATLPLLRHPDVPAATLLSELDRLPPDLDQYVLKPLFSFSGGGVVVGPTAADVDRVPEDERAGWCLQRRIEYAPCVVNPDGDGIKCEIRLMYLKPKDAPRPILALNLARLARGLLVGTAFNRDYTWVGSTVALWPEH